MLITWSSNNHQYIQFIPSNFKYKASVHWDTTAKINGTTGVQDNDKRLPLWTTEQLRENTALVPHALLSVWDKEYPRSW